MTPDYLISVDGKDLTNLIRNRLIRMALTDVSGVISDTLEIVLDDRKPSIDLPRTGVKLTIALGYKETGLDPKGIFIVDEPVLSGPPDTLTIRSRSADLRKGLKEKRIRSFDNISVGDLVATIAKAHGYQPRVAEELASIPLEHLDQDNQSDMNLLTELAKRYDAVAKPVNDLLLFVPRGQVKSFSGKDLPAVHKVRSDLNRWNASFPERDKYSSVIAVYRDTDQAKDIEVVVGSGSPAKRLIKKQPNAAIATAAAKSEFESLQRGNAKISGSCAGDVAMAAEAKLILSDVRPGVDGDWALTQVVHEITDAGYVCNFEGEIPS
ncbi:contractile injection system protein, VgrG/Pvc8 family [uncultured Desulfuromusa sp.]|uniref:contractile injection system protein, VgrG/Pvc8 family n=1 Tax=uncultured Desulfuromusa sp. TaxID=219183 RepID=UPI002AA693AC|nr:contractile injection system protein, VgrG/Pvc8 family [uncultured Desulfuromusa sp.]